MRNKSYLAELTILWSRFMVSWSSYRQYIFHTIKQSSVRPPPVSQLFLSIFYSCLYGVLYLGLQNPLTCGQNDKFCICVTAYKLSYNLMYSGTVICPRDKAYIM